MEQMVKRNDTVAPTQPTGRPGADIQLKNIHHGFFHGRDFVRAVWDVSLSIAPGELLSVVGPSGCGKTTLLGMVAGLMAPRRGEVLVDGTPVTRPRPDIAYMQARDALMPWRNVRQNVELGLEVHGVPRPQRTAKAQEWIERVGLADFADSRVTQLSQGMRQRVAIARTLAQEPRCILMDEPFAALDAQTRSLQQQEFLRLWSEQGATVIFVTHDLSEAILLGDRVMLMSNRPGTVVVDVPIELPRPRPTEMQFEDQNFLGYRSELTRMLKVEVDKAREAGVAP
jgi:NitT/TauT family transport system ATP-binding protein